jgi:DNA recombination protein RmuC
MHVNAIAAKYVLCDECTFDFALMYVSAENIYYETIITGENSSERRQLLALRCQNV